MRQKKHKFKPELIGTHGIIQGTKFICGICKQDHWQLNHREESARAFKDLSKSMREHDENYPIKKLQPYIKYKVPTLNNKINEIIQRINKEENK